MWVIHELKKTQEDAHFRTTNDLLVLTREPVVPRAPADGLECDDPGHGVLEETPRGGKVHRLGLQGHRDRIAGKLKFLKTWDSR